jgi:cysteine synthase A
MKGIINRGYETKDQNPDNYFMPQQFRNTSNPEVHRRTTAYDDRMG